MESTVFILASLESPTTITYADSVFVTRLRILYLYCMYRIMSLVLVQLEVSALMLRRKNMECRVRKLVP